MHNIDQICAEFTILDGWEARYGYIMELGSKLPEFPAAEKNDEYLVSGCLSRVWLRIGVRPDGYPCIDIDSDSAILKGLSAILVSYYARFPAEQLAKGDAMELFGRLKLQQHLSPTRRNGLYQINRQIRSYKPDPAV